MSNPINHVQLIGNLAKAPELRTTNNDKAVCNLRLAVDGLGGHEEAGYIDLAVWGKPGEACARTLAEGWLIATSGALEIRPWTTDDKRGINISVPFATVKFLKPPKGKHEEPVPAGAAPGDDDIPF